MLDYPKELTGNVKEDLARLWESLWKITEELQLLEERLNEHGIVR